MKSYVKMPNKHILQNKFCCVFCGGKHWATQIQSISDTLWLFLCLQCGNCLESDIYLWWIDGLTGATYGMHECSCLTFRTCHDLQHDGLSAVFISKRPDMAF